MQCDGEMVVNDVVVRQTLGSLLSFLYCSGARGACANIIILCRNLMNMVFYVHGDYVVWAKSYDTQYHTQYTRTEWVVKLIFRKNRLAFIAKLNATGRRAQRFAVPGDVLGRKA